VLLNRLPRTLSVEASTVFEYSVPVDTFWSESYGFNLTLTFQQSLPSWLSFDASTRTFSGIPLNSDVGLLTIWIVAQDGKGRSSLREPLTVLVRENTRDDYLLTVYLTVSLPFNSRRRMSDNDIVQESKDCNTDADVMRRAPVAFKDCSLSDTLSAANRFLILSKMSGFLSTQPGELSLTDIRTVNESPCQILVEISDNSVGTCLDASLKAQDIELARDDGRLEALLAPTFSLAALSLFAPECTVVVDIPAGESTATTSDFSATIAPVAIIAGVILLVGLLAFIMFRHRAHKQDKGVNVTFGPKSVKSMSEARIDPSHGISNSRDAHTARGAPGQVPDFQSSEMPVIYEEATPEEEETHAATGPDNTLPSYRRPPPYQPRVAPAHAQPSFLSTVRSQAEPPRLPEYKFPPSYTFTLASRHQEHAAEDPSASASN
jgi:hypothetical protein